MSDYTANEQAALPPSDNMGVTFGGKQFSFHLDYLRLTLWMDRADFDTVWFRYASDLGGFVDLEHGGRFYRRVLESSLGVRLYVDPSGEQNDPRQMTLEVPGKACQYLGFERLQNLYIYLTINADRSSVSRIDLAFDGAPFTVSQFWEAVNAPEGCRTWAKRDTFKYIVNPYEKAENGSQGVSTAYIGHRTSLRMLRVYDKHGFTRAELEVHDERADQIALDLFNLNMDEICEGVLDRVSQRAIGHLRDFIDISADWWMEFTAGCIRAYCKMTGQNPQEIDAEKVVAWLFKQVSAAYSVVVDIYGENTIKSLLAYGRLKRDRNKKYRLIMQGGVD